jgi:hypothetical protein
MAVAGLANRRQLAFGEVAGEQRAAFPAEIRVLAPELGIGLDECVGRRADQIVQHEIRSRGADLGDQPRHVGLADRQVAFPQHFSAGVDNQVAGNAVGLPAPDVVGPEQETVGAEARHHMRQQRNQMLVRAGMHVDDMVVGLETFIGTAIPKRAAGLLHNRNGLLAAPRGGAAQDVASLAVAENVFAKHGIAVGIPLRVALDRNQFDLRRRIGVEIGDGPQGAEPARFRNQAVGAERE